MSNKRKQRLYLGLLKEEQPPDGEKGIVMA